jgi:hypothetical protein
MIPGFVYNVSWCCRVMSNVAHIDYTKSRKNSILHEIGCVVCETLNVDNGCGCRVPLLRFGCDVLVAFS